MSLRTVVILLAFLGIAFTAYVEFGTVRAADVERSLAWFAFEAAPYILLLLLALFTPLRWTLLVIGVALLLFEFYAWFQVFGQAKPSPDAPLIYLDKPLYGLGLLAVGLLAGFLLGRARRSN